MRKGFLPFHLLVLLAFASCNIAAQTNSDYLKSLEGEATGLTLDSETRGQPKESIKSSADIRSVQSWSSEEAGGIKDLIPGLTIEQFEIVLKNNYIGSYLFYKRLKTEQKNEVYAFYQQTPDPDQLRKKILQVSKK